MLVGIIRRNTKLVILILCDDLMFVYGLEIIRKWLWLVLILSLILLRRAETETEREREKKIAYNCSNYIVKDNSDGW